jgi:hypothetical protein
VGYLLLADSHTFVCRTWDDLASRLVWTREQGYATAKARRVDGYVDMPLLPSEQLRLVEDATRLVPGYPGRSRGSCRWPSSDGWNQLLRATGLPASMRPLP